MFGKVRILLDLSTKIETDRRIDYPDMIYLPLVLDLVQKRFPLLFVDEAQDLNFAQQEMVVRAGHRLVLVGDPHQAIYGFAGADDVAMKTMEKYLGSTKRGVETYPLTVTRRCSTSVVKEAQKIVPDFHAHEDNTVGCVESHTLNPSTQYVLFEVESTTLSGLISIRSTQGTLAYCVQLLRGDYPEIVRSDHGTPFGSISVFYETDLDQTAGNILGIVAPAVDQTSVRFCCKYCDCEQRPNYEVIFEEIFNGKPTAQAFQFSMEGMYEEDNCNCSCHGGEQIEGDVPTYWDYRVVEKSYHLMVSPGDLILCRINAPLIRECFALLRQRIKCNINGRTIGEGLINLVESFKAHSIGELTEKLEAWEDTETRKEMARNEPDNNRLLAIRDKADCVMTFVKEARSSVSEVIQMIQEMFGMDMVGSEEVGFSQEYRDQIVLLSSIHKAKGSEAPNVFVIYPHKLPHPMAKLEWEQKQERNLKYVAITRAIDRLVWVRGEHNEEE